MARAKIGSLRIGLTAFSFLAAAVSACGSGPAHSGVGGQASTSAGGVSDAGGGEAGAGTPNSSGGIDQAGGAAGGLGEPGGAAGWNDAGGHGIGEAGGEGGGDGQVSCASGVTYGGGEASLSGTSVTAAIVDENGAPVAGQVGFICGLDLCSSPAMTDAAGKVTLQFSFSEKKPAFKFGDFINYAGFAVPLTKVATDFTTGGQVLATGKLSDKPGVTLAPGGDAKSGDVTVSVPAGGTVALDTLTYDTTETQKFRAVGIPLTHLGPVLASANLTSGEPGFALVFGVAPSETLLCPAAKVTVALPHETAVPYNDLGWAPGTAVEFWIASTDVFQLYAPYAGWAKASDGVVSSDGASVATSGGRGNGFLILENFAIRKAP